MRLKFLAVRWRRFLCLSNLILLFFKFQLPSLVQSPPAPAFIWPLWQCLCKLYTSLRWNLTSTVNFGWSLSRCQTCYRKFPFLFSRHVTCVTIKLPAAELVLTLKEYINDAKGMLTSLKIHCDGCQLENIHVVFLTTNKILLKWRLMLNNLL